MTTENIKLSIILLLTVIFVIPVFAQDDNGPMLDPFLQRELKRTGFHPNEFTDIQNYGLLEKKLSRFEEKIYDVVIYGENTALSNSGLIINSQFDGFITSRILLQDLPSILSIPGITKIELGPELDLLLETSIPEMYVDLVHSGTGLNMPYTGKNVIIGVLDTGIDVFHPDFRMPGDQNKSRIISIWDVTKNPISGESRPEGFNYGVEYTRDQIERELRGETSGAIRAKDTHGHGTHVAGIAGGNGMYGNGFNKGVAPDAEFIIVAFPDARFVISQIIDGLVYIFSKADELQRPAVVNLSIGGHSGSHDGTASYEQAIDELSQEPGRAVTVSAGNSGNRQVHQGGVIAPGDSTTFQIIIPSYSPGSDEYVFSLLWYELPLPQSLKVTVKSPSGHIVSARSGERKVETTSDGGIELDTFNNAMNPKNARLFWIEFFQTQAGIPPKNGTWQITVHNESETDDAIYNTWLASYSMRTVNVIISPNTGRRHTVTMPGTAEKAITVGSYRSRNSWIDKNGVQRSTGGQLGDISPFSGGGPTRDGRLKPDLMAPGQVIAAPLSGDSSYDDSIILFGGGYVLFQGTSMSAPHIAGIVALMFEVNPHLDAEVIKQTLQNTAREDGWTSSTPNEFWGFGKTHAHLALQETEQIVSVTDKDLIVMDFKLSQNYPNPFNPVTTISFIIPRDKQVQLSVYNILGYEISVLVNETLAPAEYKISFDASSLPSGVYFYRLTTPSFSETKKMLLIK